MRLPFTLVALFAFIVPASAVTFDYTFIVTPGGPAGTISGSFSGSFTPGAGIDVSSLSSVHLAINGFTYTTANTLLEVSNSTAGGLGFFKLGGQLNGINTVATGTNDFLVLFENQAGGVRPITFGYTTVGSNSFFNTSSFVAFPTPDSGGTALLLSIGCFALMTARRKSKP